MMSVEEIIALGWRGQAKGSRTELEDRVTILQLYIDKATPMHEAARKASSTLPINAQTAWYRKELALEADKLDKANKAFKVISAELGRRGGYNE